MTTDAVTTDPVETYLDHAASSPMHPEAIEAMVPFLAANPANPTGAHGPARRARRAVDDARDDLADLLGVGPGEVVFTSGGTESDNLAVLGGAARAADAGAPATVVCSAVEHPAVLEAVRSVGGRVVGVDRHGVVDLDALAAALDPDVALVSVMAVNNETGVVQPLDAVAAVVAARAPGAWFHTDAVQALGWLEPNRFVAPADAVSISGHKFGGPKGVGALVWGERARITPRQIGGGQERGRRSGTPSVAAIVGMAVAARVTHERRSAERARLAALRDRLVTGLVATVDGLSATVTPTVAGPVGTAAPVEVAAGFAHVCVTGVASEAVLFLLDEDGIAAAAASSCASGAQQASHVLAAMGVDEAAGALRFTLGWTTTDADVDHVLRVVPAAIARLRAAGAAGPTGVATCG